MDADVADGQCPFRGPMSIEFSDDSSATILHGWELFDMKEAWATQVLIPFGIVRADACCFNTDC